ncbi:iron chelate uptake ABC transporter family permease subunit [Actinoplanes sp. NBRC 103695]|uniref:iron chelate uptake ABC transporter family permease subunit n=1 Tax=Actinoplanes sp. NBRC 103695 TaxID=3032202 RepID=UPI0024A4ED75|nr:iron chelate uptake ABC transporter family permease subunit [Actinoplanes sp. NBRC 103695]GLZ01131.1 hypothetical protein Acsp02_83820 [Actinoplanes sp. NBRC 103695]
MIAGLGIDVNRLRLGLLAAASLLTATIVSVAGGIGFVGLLVPHAVRLLDEPTNHLDIGAQLELLDLVRELGLTTVAALHELDHAVAYCDAVALLDQGRVVAAGEPVAVLTLERLADVFGVRAAVTTHPLTGRPHLVFATAAHQFRKEHSR